MRFTPCECDPAHHKLVPRKWWMRAFRTRHRYRCSACKTIMLLKDAEAPRTPWGYVAAALVVALGGAYFAIGYWETWAENQERRVLTREWE